MKQYLILILCLVSSIGFGQDKTYTEEDLTISKWIDGTLLTPNAIDKPNLAIIIAGSGPTNRNGNQNFMKNNSLKKLAEGLTDQGIATYRYDKRIVKQILKNNVDKDMTFDDFVNDASDVINYFKEKNTFHKIYVIGHSQGSLVGMLSAKEKADGFISLAGAGHNIGDVLIEQVTQMAPKLGEETQRVVNILKSGENTTDYPDALGSLFGPEIQDFMINWMSYNPTEIIKDLKMPILIVNGTKDLQVSVSEAEVLNEAHTEAELLIIENMNHVLFEIEGDDLENSKSYNESFRPISPQLISGITAFIKS
ncbi:alpha/beta hydrolase family protein [Winogradskyella psychrotolerans]|uniref:alpha/beta hydrolase family protein n=1 Tax=Winogradskyella psychrotolerans TaxID=1344585 RepID=UPI001C06AC04|nr:alpha/beta hydrolase [Winogradskyella psychrotolerans]MBU2928508.1 lysophospholipase [Winogradskyella psychrotolerans]